MSNNFYRVVIEQYSPKTYARKTLSRKEFEHDREAAITYFKECETPKIRKGQRGVVIFREYAIKSGFEITGTDYELEKRYVDA